MKQIISYLFAINLIVLTTCCTSFAADRIELSQSIAKIIVSGKKLNAFSDPVDHVEEGTGFFITSNGYLTTSRHVIYPKGVKWATAPTIHLLLPSQSGALSIGQRVTGELKIDIEKFDFALIKIDGTTVPISCEYYFPQKSDSVSLSAYGENSYKERDEANGQVLAEGGIGTAGRAVAVLKSHFGHSGAPIVLNETGRVVGFVSQGTINTRNEVRSKTHFYLLEQVRDKLPAGTRCAARPKKCFRMISRKGRTLIANGQKSDCASSQQNEENRVVSSVAAFGNATCTHYVSTQMQVESPNLMKGVRIAAEVIVGLDGQSGGYGLFDVTDNPHGTLLSGRNWGSHSIFLRNGHRYKIETNSQAGPGKGNSTSRVSFEVSSDCK